MTLLAKSDRIYVAGSTGMVGSSICKLLIKNGFTYENSQLLTSSRKVLDLEDANKLDLWFGENKPDIVICAAAKVGGILANRDKPVDFLLKNLKIQTNIIESSWKFGVKRFLFLGSSCIYPKLCQQPIKEEYLLENSLESTNQWYALAKIAGLKLCEAYKDQYNFDAISLMPTNLYGPSDNYKKNESHVFASLIRKFYTAKINNEKSVTCWGSGKPLREFLYVDDLAEASLFVLKNWYPNNNNSPKSKEGKNLNWLNVGSKFEISVNDLAKKISEIVGFDGKIIWDKTKPDGTPRKKLNTDYINKLGWFAKTDLEKGILKTLESYKYELNTKSVRI